MMWNTTVLPELDSDRWVVLTDAGIPKGNDNCRDCRPHIFHNPLVALMAAEFGDHVVRYDDYLERRRWAIDLAVRRIYERWPRGVQMMAEGIGRIFWPVEEIRGEFTRIMAEKGSS